MTFIIAQRPVRHLLTQERSGLPLHLLICTFCLTIILSCGGDKQDSSSGSKGDSTDIQLLVGTYTRQEGHVDGHGEGIYLCRFDSSMKKMLKKSAFTSGTNPSFIGLHPDGQFLYAVNETGGQEEEPVGQIQAFVFDSEGPGLNLLNTASSHGVAPCHISITSDGSHVLTANYLMGTVAAYPIQKNGAVGRSKSIIRFKGKSIHPRQEAPHAHCILQGPDGLIYTADLGTDSIRVFELSGGRLKRTQKSFTVKEGAGPRHLTFHPTVGVMYVLNELNGEIEVFRLPTEEKSPERIQDITTKSSPEGFAGSADIHLTPDGRFLYASNRGDFNEIAIFEVDQDTGLLTLTGHEPVRGKTPRNFTITREGRHLIVANQDSDQLVVFEINQSNGRLSLVAIYDNLFSPVCLVQV